MLAQAKDKRQKTHPNSTGEQEGQAAGISGVSNLSLSHLVL
jgi:hypothetical protein